MAVKKKTAAEGHNMDTVIRDAIAASVAKLYERHAHEIDELRRESETQEVTINFAAGIDFSESTPTVTVGIRYTKSYTDKMVSQIDDPSQGTFSEVVAQAEAQPVLPKRSRKKPAEDAGEAGA